MKFIVLFCSLIIVFSNAYSNDADLTSLDHWLAIHGVPDDKNAGHTWPEDLKAKFFADLVKSNPHIKTVAEIGFCFGHSAEIFFKTKPDISVLSFDLMSHWYCYTGKDYIDLKYPNRHALIVGDSRKTVPEFLKGHRGTKFDLILVDGGHEYDVALADILNMRHFAKPDTILIVDDTNFGPINDAWEKCKSDGIVEEIERFTSYAMGWLVGRYVFPANHEK